VSDSDENKKTGNIGADFIGYTVTFNADGTYEMSALLQLKGKWSVSSWDGKTAKVKMTPSLFGMDANPVTATFKFRDADHADYDDGQTGPGSQGIRCVLKRATQAEVLAASNAMKPGEKAGGNTPFGGAFPPGFPKGFPQPGTEPAPGKPGGAPIIWSSQTVNPGGLSLIVPAALEKGGTGAGPHAGVLLRWTDFKAVSPAGTSVTEVRVRNYANLRFQKGVPGGRSPTEFVAAAYLAREAGAELPPARTFEKDGRKAAVYARPGAGLYLAIGDDKTVAVIACLGANLTEADPIVKAIFDSVTFN